MKYFFFILTFISFSVITAQTDDAGGATALPDFNTIVKIPNSPEASSIIQYGNIPISMYTGRPDISIPIHTIQGKELNLPISLSYDASGIKVSQISTNIGLGWNLNAGGVVTRHVNGIADEVGNIDQASRQAIISELFDSGVQGYHPQGWLVTFFQEMKKRNEGEADFLPDVFSFSINGLSGEIAVDYSKKIPGTNRYFAYCINDPSIKVDYTGNGTKVNSWLITGANGITYTFGKPEVTHSSFSNLVDVNSGIFYEGTHTYNSAWYITSIINANQTESIEFDYTYGQYWDTEQPVYGANTITHKLNDCFEVSRNGHQMINNPSTYKIFQFNLQHISYNGHTQVSFIEGHDRTDLPGRKNLNKIWVQDQNGVLVKEIDLVQSYFEASESEGISSMPELRYRLKLDEVKMQETSTNSGIGGITEGSITQAPQVYSFEYYKENEIPNRFSKSLDYWGYYNGRSFKHLVPKKILNQGTDNEIILPGADRSASLPNTIVGTLEKIHYPTGGNTTFWYDLHRTPVRFGTDYRKVNLGGVSVRGGLTNNFDKDDYASCDDAITEARAPKKRDSEPFTIEESGDYQVEIIETTSGIQTTSTIGIGSLAAIYSSNKGTGECQDTVLGNVCDLDGPVRSYCDLHNKSITDDIPFLKEGPHLTPGVFNTYIPKGDYRAVLLSEYNNKSYILKITKTVPVQIRLDNKIGGLRVYRTQDEVSNEGQKLTKYYYYNDISKLATSDITESVLSNQSESLGIAHRPLVFDDTSHFKFYAGEGLDGCIGACNEKNEVTLSRYANNTASPTPLHVSYDIVSEISFENDQINGYTVNHFYNEKDYESGIYKKQYFNNGKPKLTQVFDSTGKKLKEDHTIFEQVYLSDEDTPKAIGSIIKSKTSFSESYSCTVAYSGEGTFNDKEYLGYPQKTCQNVSAGGPDTSFVGHYIHPDCNGTGTAVRYFGRNTAYYTSNRISYEILWPRVKQTTSTEYFDSGSITTTKTYEYENLEHLQPTQVITTTSNGKVVKTKMRYPQDMNTPTQAEQELIDQHRIASPIHIIQQEENGSIIFETSKKTEYAIWHADMVLPKTIKSAKNDTNLEPRIIYYEYDTFGNPLEISKTAGAHITYIWGYNHQYPIAKIQNASYSDISAYVSNLQTLSNTDNDRTLNYSGNEGALRKELDALRDTLKTVLPNAMVTTYTYDPLVGITSMTDPRGYTMYYEYDGFTRLMHIRDADGNILNKYYYNYAGESISQMQVSINTSKDWEYTNRTLNFEATVNGGSDRLNYNWEVTATNNQNSTYTTKDINIPTGSSEGNLSVKLTVRDLATGVTKTIEKTITIYQPITASINVAKDWIYINSTMSTTATASQGSGNYSYTWEVAKPLNQNTQHNGQQFDLQSGNVAGTATITLTVKDNVTGQSITKTKNIDIYQTQQARIDNVPQWMFVSTSKTLKAVASQGSGNYDYTWKVTKPDNQIATHTSKDINFSSGTTAGTANIELTVKDNVTGQTVDVAKTIEIYDRIAFGNITAPSEVNLNSDATFDINPSKGSGQYTYDWELRARTTYRSSQKSFTLNMGCSYFGTVQIKCTIKDKVTGETKTLTTQTNVKQAALISGTITSTPPISSPPRTQKFQVQAKVNNGSGDYSYKWYVNGVAKGNNSTLEVTLKCSNPKTATVKCEITDNCIDQTFSATRSFTIASTRCNDDGPGGGGPGGGDDSDDSDNSNQ